MKPSAFEKSAKDRKADKKHGMPENSKTDRAQDKRDGKPMPPFMMKKKGGKRGM